MAKKLNVKKLLIALVILAVLALAVFGIAALVRRGTGKVDVYPVSELITDASWVTDSQIEGTVTTDENQSVYISSTEQVTEVYVREGQTVKVGDPILAFDTTLTDLELERQRLEVEVLKLDIKDTEEELRVIGTLKAGSGSSSRPSWPSNPSTPSDPTTSTPPGEMTPVSPLPYEKEPGALGTRADPFVYLWNDSCLFSQSFFQQLAQTAAERRQAAAQEGEEEDDPDGSGNSDSENVYVICEVRRSDALGGELLRVWEMELMPSGGVWTFRMIEPAYSAKEESIVAFASSPDQLSTQVSYGAYIDTSASYTSAEITAMRQDCTKRLKSLKQELKMAELTYDSLEYELSNGEVFSKIDGVVATIIDADEARLEGKPMVVISGGGGYYVTAALGEMDLDTLAVGDAVTVQSWENYGQSEGTITEISEYPDENGRYWYYSNGNQNVSLYPFKIFVDASAGLREGEWVTVSLTGKGERSNAMFLDMSFVRQENGESYVYAVGEDGRLEQRSVKTGRNLWGSYVEILSGLTQEESIAFPYGRQTRDGAKVRYAEVQELYASMYY